MKAYTKGRQFYTKTIKKLNRGTYAAKDDANGKPLDETIIINQCSQKSKLIDLFRF